MANCITCGFHMGENDTECPQCKRIQENKVVEKTEESDNKVICGVCGNPYDPSAKVCPNCLEIRQTGGNKEAADRKAAEKSDMEKQMDKMQRTGEQFVAKEKSPLTLPVIIAIALVVLAVIGFAAMSFLG